VSNIVVTKGFVEPTPKGGGVFVPPVDVESTIGTPPTADESTPGISPANAEPESAQQSEKAISIRFIKLSPLTLRGM
jgi:hypothetical protein